MGPQEGTSGVAGGMSGVARTTGLDSADSQSYTKYISPLLS